MRSQLISKICRNHLRLCNIAFSHHILGHLTFSVTLMILELLQQRSSPALVTIKTRKGWFIAPDCDCATALQSQIGCQPTNLTSVHCHMQQKEVVMMSVMSVKTVKTVKWFYIYIYIYSIQYRQVQPETAWSLVCTDDTLCSQKKILAK